VWTLRVNGRENSPKLPSSLATAIGALCIGEESEGELEGRGGGEKKKKKKTKPKF